MVAAFSAEVVAVAQTAGRTLALLSLLRTADRWSGPVLADRLGVSLRTLRRDVQTLRDLGYPVRATGGRDSTYAMERPDRLPPLLLDAEEVVAISLALQTAPTAVVGQRTAADRARQTLVDTMPARLRVQLDATRITAVENLWEFAAPPVDPVLLASVGEAVSTRVVLRYEVRRPDGSRPGPRDPDFLAPQRIEPHHLVVWAGRWYVVGRDPVTGRWPVRRIDRLHLHASTGVRFDRGEVPGGDVAEHVVTDPDRGDLPAVWPCHGSAVLGLPADVVARFAPGGSVIQRVDDGHARLRLGAWSWAGIAGILATFGCELTDVEPAELRTECRAQGRRLTAAFRDGDG